MKRLQFVLGKGGVGKSTIACALARYWTLRDKTVLLVQVRATDSHSPILQISRTESTITQVESHLYTINLDPLLCLKEYLQLRASIPFISDLLFRPAMLATVVDFVPGLAELVMMGKITYQLEAEPSEDPKFDCIIVDMPASGHAIKMLQIAKSTQSLVKIGRLAADTQRMQSIIANPALCCIHLVTMLDDLPAQEVLEMAEELQKNGWSNLGTLFINRVRTSLKIPDEPPMEAHQAKALRPIWELWSEDAQTEAHWLNELSSRLELMPKQIFKEILSVDFGPEQLMELVGQMQ